MDIQVLGWILTFSAFVLMFGSLIYSVINGDKRRKKLITDLSNLEDVDLINDYKKLQRRMRDLVNTLDKTPGNLSERDLSEIFVKALLERQFRGDDPSTGDVGTGSFTDG